MSYITEWTAAGADIPQNHEGGSAVGEALTKVGAGCLFTDAAKFTPP